MLTLQGVTKRYGDPQTGTLAVQDLTFDVGTNEVVTIVGPSGCGKTTVLKLMAGRLATEDGPVSLQHGVVTLPPHEIVLVFQCYHRIA